MSFGLSRGKDLDPGFVEVAAESLPPIPDDVLQRPSAAHIDPRAWFDTPTNPLEIEIGSGKGTFLVGQAAAQPDTNFLGFEYAREFCVYAADRIRRAGLRNVRMMSVDAGEFVHWRIPDACARVIHLYFPDPWPKTRHNRRRMLQEKFLLDAHRVLAPGGELRVVTDHADYWAWMEEHIARVLHPTATGRPVLFDREEFRAPPTAREGELVGTNFERKYRLNPGSGGGGTAFFAVVLRKR